MKIKNPMHPGIYLKKAYLEPLKITTASLSLELGVNASTVSRLTNGKMELTATMAVLLEKRFDKSAEFWLSMSQAHQLNKARKKFKINLA